MGIQIVQDDLGSGHSSLLRMDRYAFDVVKIDQGLVRSALRKPQRALEFILYLTRLAHAFKTPVTVEGLENLGMIEAAAILGADFGQGYGIAKPMPASDIITWHQGYVYSVNPKAPRTALGAMAGYMLWDLQLASTAHWSKPLEELMIENPILDQYIANNSLQGSSLDQILRDRQISNLAEPPVNLYQDSRTKVIEVLTEYWLAETGKTP